MMVPHLCLLLLENNIPNMVSILLEANANPNIRVDYGATTSV